MLLTLYGLREWLTATVVAGVLIAIFVLLGWWWAAGATVLPWLAAALFFRDPPRRVPRDLPPGSLLSPADGRVTAVTTVEHHEALGGPALVIRVFLSVLNVHVNRAPCDGTVERLRHSPGRYHDARSPECATENEHQLITMRLDGGPAIGLRQIAGKVARRIVCDLRPGQRLVRGQRFGMIKFGSGAELILPPALVSEVHVSEGARVKGGVTVLATLVPAAVDSAISDQRSAISREGHQPSAISHQ